MTESPLSPTRPNLRWLWIIAAGMLILVILCIGVGVFVWLRSSADPITPRLERSANAALQNPTLARIQFGHNTYHDWYPANGTDYAVENGMAIFPQPPDGNPIQRRFEVIIGDVTMPALVYAPGGQTLPQDAAPPVPGGRSWAYIGEWFLYRCTPISAHPGWWSCMLLVGGNI